MHCKRLVVFFSVFFSLSLSCLAQQTIIDQVDNVFLDTLINLAKRNYPRTKYFEAKTNVSREALQAQKLSWFDPFSFSYQYLPNNQVNAVNPVFLNGYQLGIYVNFGSIIQKPALIRKARHEYAASTSEMQEYDKNLEAEVKKRYYDYLLQLNMVRVISKSLIDAEGLKADINIRYQKSEISFEEYSKALVIFNGNVQSKLEAEANLLTAKAALEELVGIKLEEIIIHGSK